MSTMLASLKKEFPFFAHHPELIYLDSAATTHKPQAVIDAISTFYAQYNAPIHRGVYHLAEQATAQYEAVREHIARTLGATAHEIIFTSGATESINMVAHAWAAQVLTEGDEIVLSELEHHANLVPWIQLATEKKLIIRSIPIRSNWSLDTTQLTQIITPKTKLVAFTINSNIIGAIDAETIKLITHRAREVGAHILVDAAQAAPHQKISVQELSCDFLVFSGHKMLGPTGVGILYAKESTHQRFSPYKSGGGMVTHVDYGAAQWRDMPYRLEAGTPPIAQVIGLGAAETYLRERVDFNELQKHEASLCAQLIDGLQKLPGVTILGDPEKLSTTGHIICFGIEGYHPHDIATYLDLHHNICVRAGNHCTQPVHVKMGILASVRASFYLYNTPQDVEKLLFGIKKLLC